MGVALSKLRTEIPEGTAEKTKILEQLDFLKSTAKSKLQIFRGEMELMFSKSRSGEPMDGIPGKRALRYNEYYSVQAERGVTVTESVKTAIGQIIRGGKTISGGGADNITQGVTTLMESLADLAIAAVDTVLGSNEVGETQKNLWFLTLHNNSWVRIDVKIWKYQFSNKEVMASVENACCYLTCLSIVEPKDLSPSELIYFISEQFGGNLEKVNEYVALFLKVWEQIKKLHNEVREGTIPEPINKPHYKVREGANPESISLLAHPPAIVEKIVEEVPENEVHGW